MNQTNTLVGKLSSISILDKKLNGSSQKMVGSIIGSLKKRWSNRSVRFYWSQLDTQYRDRTKITRVLYYICIFIMWYLWTKLDQAFLESVSLATFFLCGNLSMQKSIFTYAHYASSWLPAVNITYNSQHSLKAGMYFRGYQFCMGHDQSNCIR